MLATLDLGDLDKFTEELALALNPFADAVAAQAEGADEAHELSESSARLAPFDPFKPCVQALECSLEAKFQLVCNIFCNDIFIPLIEKGEMMACVASAVAGQVLSILEKSLEHVEEIPDELADILTVCRCLVTILGPCADPDSCDAAKEVHKSGMRSDEGVIGDIAAAMRKSEFYDAFLNELVKHLPESRLHLPKLLDLQSQLLASPTSQWRTTINLVHDCMKFASEVRAVLRKGATTKLETVCQEHLEAAIRDCQNMDVDQSLEPINALIVPLAYACDTYPAADVLHVGHDWCLKATVKASQRAMVKNVLDGVAKCTVADDGSFDPNLLTATEKMVRDSGLKTIEGQQAQGQLGLVLQKWVAVAGDVEAVRAAAVQILRFATPLLGNSEVGNVLQATGQLLERLVTVGLAAHKYKALGDSHELRVAKDIGSPHISAVIRELGALKEAMLTKAVVNPKVCDACAASVAEADALVEAASEIAIGSATADLTHELESMRNWCRGGPHGSSWAADLPATASLDDVVAKADETFMKNPPQTFLASKAQLAKLLAEVSKVSSIFGKDLDEQIASQVAEVQRALTVSSAEGMLIALLRAKAAKTTPREKKAKCHALAKGMPDPQNPWVEVQPTLRAVVAKALKLL